MKMSRLSLSLACACLAICFHSLHAAEDTAGYQLSAERPEAYGNYYAFSSEAFHSTHTTESLNGQLQSEEKQTIEAKIVGTAWVSDATGQGDIAEVVIYPAEYAGKVNGEEVEINIDERLYVQMNNGALKVYNSNGQAKSPEVIQVLGALLGFMLGTDESELSQDAMLALDQPRKPGQSWQCDQEALADSLNKTRGIRATPDHLHSKLTFAKVDKLFEQDAAVLDLSIKLNRFAVPALEERGLSIDESAGSVNVQRVLPIDKASMNGKVSKQINLTTTASKDVPEQGKLQVKRVTTHKSQAEYQTQR